MKTDKYSISDILEFKNLEQFVVPELQRDYVWRDVDVRDLLESIKNSFESDGEEIPYLGFIYAYNDKDYPYKYFLVDGQQRLTTIYLLLLVCYQKINKKLPEYLIKNDKLKLDYKVRLATHDFLINLVKTIQKNLGAENISIKDQSWYHKHYENDGTIQTMINNYYCICNWISDEFPIVDRLAEFLKFIEDKVELSYFDIENGRDGEELYIYMNSRGKQLEANETLKASFLSKVTDDEEKDHWGAKWEEWQDFFWKNRGKRIDADPGFNDFLRILQIITMSELGMKPDDINFIARSNDNKNLVIKYLPSKLETIDSYFNALLFISNSEKINNYLVKYETSDFYTLRPINERERLNYYFRCLPALAFIAKTGTNDEHTAIQFIRYFYNNSRKSNIGKDISNQLPTAIKLIQEYCKNKEADYDICDLVNFNKNRTVLIDDEEVRKLNLYKNPPENITREELEELFWTTEDHPIFHGEISFLLDKYYNTISKTFDFWGFKKTWNAFNTLFAETNVNYGAISRTLLFYGYTWFQDTPYYYSNYDCQDWSRLVRSDTGKYLIQLLEDMQEKPVTFLDIIFKRKAKEYFMSKNITTISAITSSVELFEQVRILSTIDFYSEKKLWASYRGYIADEGRFTFGDTPFFIKNRVLYNINRYVYDGQNGRIISMLSGTLQNSNKLEKILGDIIGFSE